MGSKMLIDAAQAEEIRVVVARGNKIEEFDFESATRKPLKGNIYLAKVTRVEPSLQAAFVEYGGNRHGFLAFAEIHPDYYQIPIADRQALIAEQEAEAAEDEAEEQDEASAEPASNGDAETTAAASADERASDSPAESDTPSAKPLIVEDFSPALESEPVSDDFAGEPVAAAENGEMEAAPDAPAPTAIEEVDSGAETDKVETIGSEDAIEEARPRQRRQQRPRRRQYKIQEVIKRRQILLVQVIKEERGNKGAALTTYLSLAGRYCVLMPNTARGGGISRKITDANDRRRLKELTRDVEVPKGMGVIVRTAGAQRTKPEIKRDFDYLMRLWESVRELTLQSQAPSLVYEEGDLIKRSIRDLYTKDVDEIVVEGDAAYKEAKDFMKMLMPSHAKNVKHYKDNKPLLQRYGLEAQLDSLFNPTVNLPSGGYLVINQTEALVSIDINSGRATREHNIEDTATKTNLEACDEIARQLRLRDLAGLVVIDFIDMEENRNNRNVERRLKEALKNDRARIQVGRISHFGLMEMSRQRLRPGLIEGTFKTCPHCEGRGIIRSVSSCGLGVLRQIEDYLQKGRPDNLTVKCARDVAFYLLNEKRDSLLEIEQQHGISIFLTPDHDAKAAQAIIERAPDREKIKRRVTSTTTPVQMETAFVEEAEEPVADEAIEGDTQDEAVDAEPASEERASSDGDEERRDGGRSRRRRRGRGRGRGRDRYSDQEGGAPVAQDGAAPIGENGVEQTGEAMVQDSSSESVMETEPAEGEARTEARSGSNEEGSDGNERGRRGRRRGRFGRGRDRGDRSEGRRERGDSDGGANSSSENNGGVRKFSERPPRREPEFAPPPPAVAINIPDHIPEPEPRKWQPPAPTVAPAPAERKGGWWSKK